jgi:hypothetical protein
MGRTGAKIGLLGALLLSLAMPARAQQPAPQPGPGTAPPPPAGGQSCTKVEFEDVVDEAAAALRDLTFKNKPTFQEKLRELKDKRGWSHDQFLKEAAPFVRDDKIAVFDQESERLLSDISSQGQEGAEAKTPDCALLLELRARMDVLVKTQAAKWAYMFEKLNAALAQ